HIAKTYRNCRAFFRPENGPIRRGEPGFPAHADKGVTALQAGARAIILLFQRELTVPRFGEHTERPAYDSASSCHFQRHSKGFSESRSGLGPPCSLYPPT